MRRASRLVLTQHGKARLNCARTLRSSAIHIAIPTTAEWPFGIGQQSFCANLEPSAVRRARMSDDWVERRQAELEAAAPLPRRSRKDPFVQVPLSWLERAAQATRAPGVSRPSGSCIWRGVPVATPLLCQTPICTELELAGARSTGFYATWSRPASSPSPAPAVAPRASLFLVYLVETRDHAERSHAIPLPNRRRVSCVHRSPSTCPSRNPGPTAPKRSGPLSR